MKLNQPEVQHPLHVLLSALEVNLFGSQWRWFSTERTSVLVHTSGLWVEILNDLNDIGDELWTVVADCLRHGTADGRLGYHTIVVSTEPVMGNGHHYTATLEKIVR